MAEEKKITLELTPSELFQLNLCVASRSADATIKWANACSEQEQNHCQKIIMFLNGLSAKLQAELKKVENNAEENQN